jgi:hypothetical protein
MMNHSHGVAVFVLLVGAACANGVAPARGPLRLNADIESIQLRIGDTSTVMFRLSNVGAETLRLHFPSSCQILPYVVEQQRGAVVHPAGGSWGCLTVITSLTLAPGATRVVPLLLRGGMSAASNYPEVRLSPGAYFAYARLDHSAYPLQSAPVAIDVR